jgi:hypothetical protein
MVRIFIFLFCLVTSLGAIAQTNIPSNQLIEEFVTDVLNIRLGYNYNRTSIKVLRIVAGYGRNNHNIRCSFKYAGSSWFSENTGYVEVEIISTDEIFGGYKYFEVKFFKIYGCELLRDNEEYLSLLNLEYTDKRPRLLYDKNLDKISGSITPRLIVMFK